MHILTFKPHFKKILWKNLHSDVYICLAIDKLKKVSRWIGLSVYTKSKDFQVAYNQTQSYYLTNAWYKRKKIYKQMSVNQLLTWECLFEILNSKLNKEITTT